jgi:hypothetical protein
MHPAAACSCCVLDGPGLTGDFESEVLRLSYSSLTTPPSVYDQHMATGMIRTPSGPPWCQSIDFSEAGQVQQLLIRVRHFIPHCGKCRDSSGCQPVGVNHVRQHSSGHHLLLLW